MINKIQSLILMRYETPKRIMLRELAALSDKWEQWISELASTDPVRCNLARAQHLLDDYRYSFITKEKQ